MNERKIFLGCLACYNEGRIIGQWLNLDEYDYEELEEKAKTIVKESPCVYGEEYDIQDFEGFYKLLKGSSPSLNDIWTAHEALKLIEEETDDIDLFMEFVELEGYDDLILAGNADQVLNRFGDKYLGSWKTLEEWAYDFMEDTYFSHEKVPDVIKNYFDYQAYARDCELEGSIYTIRHNGQVHVFCNN
jgi:antirestriction protein